MNFCTYFDSYYLVKGLTMYKSLIKVAKDFTLYIMAFDKECYNKLIFLALPNVVVELIDDFETPELLAVKPTRSRGEYCWTAGPSVIYHFLTHYNLSDITYLDSDLFFLGDPKQVFDEIDSSSIAITEQGLGEKQAKIYGKYCVQYMFFRNDEDGLGALSWWRDACIDWCYQKLEAKRYADQKYLDEFPLRWKNVKIIQNLGVGIAPWNMHRYSYKDNCFSYHGQTYPYIFFHMHGLKIDVVNGSLIVKSLHAALSDILNKIFFKPYAKLIQEVLEEYLGYSIKNIQVIDMPIHKQIEYKIRGWFRGNPIIQWIYFSIFKKKDKGHGSKL